MFQWLKPYMPRSLYGRAALILVVPVVTLQLVVSVVFIQRHFEGVTEQMTQGVARELRYLTRIVNTAPDMAVAMVEVRDLARGLDLTVEPIPVAAIPSKNLRRWYDFSGLVVIRVLNERLVATRVVELPDDWDVRLVLDTLHGPLSVGFDRQRLSASNPHQLFVNMVFFGMLMTLIAFIYLRNQLRPITRLARAAEAFGRGRHIPYHPSGAVEVRAAGNAFLDMRARIERQIEQRTLMLSGISHDLRTPLTRLKLGLSLIDDQDRAPMERDVEDMQRLLDEFLNFARGDAGDVTEMVDPLDLVARVVEDAQRTGIPVTLREASGAGQVALRPMAIRRALENLIGNAVRYGTRAEVSVQLTPKSLRIRVEDDGPGIPADKREEALRPFARLEPARNQNRGTGVGLGLAIATDIARSHGGVLRLGDSADLGGLQADLVIGR